MMMPRLALASRHESKGSSTKRRPMSRFLAEALLVILSSENMHGVFFGEWSWVRLMHTFRLSDEAKVTTSDSPQILSVLCVQLVADSG